MALRLRGHHILCLLGYRGFGYSPEHIAQMWEVKNTLGVEPETEVEVLAGPDGVCQSCPHLREGGCAIRRGSEVRVRGRDRRVMARLGLSEGDRLTWGGVLERLRAKITPAVLSQLCRGCRWLPQSYCREGLKATINRDGKDV